MAIAQIWLLPRVLANLTSRRVMNEKIVLYVDGGCSGNSQRDISKRRMVSVVTRKNGKVIIEEENFGGSNNIAELIAVKEALRWCAWKGIKEVEIRTDSKNNIAWVYGKKVGKKINDRGWVLRLKEEINEFLEEINMSLIWGPRETNLAGHYIEDKQGL